MTIVQLLNRIARRSRTGDITKMALDEQMDVLQAANAALQRAYNALPTYLKEKTEGFVLPAPMTLSNVSVTQFSTILSSGIFDPSQIGRTVVIAGDPQWNVILGPQNLQNPYMGPTGVAATATIYGNAVYSTTYPFDRIIGDPMFADTGMGPLIPMTMGKSNANWNWLFQQTIGRPKCWRTQMMGNSQGNQPLLVVRFAPAPDQAYSIYIRLSFWPKRFLIEDIQGATTIPVADQLLESSLIPLGIQELMNTASWKSISPEADKRADDRGAAAEKFCKDQVSDPTAPANEVFTPIGF